LWEDHARKVSSGEVARLQGMAIQISESINKELRKQVESFLNIAVRVVKKGMQDVAKELQVNIGFLFQKQTSFDTGLAALERTDPLLADYLRQTRTWSAGLLESRRVMEHDGWMLPRVTYSRTDRSVKAEEPFISGQPVSVFVIFMLNQLACFIEELTVHCLQKKLLSGVTITEIALAHREANMPVRFRLTLANGGLPEWRIAFHRSSFEET
jgi:hypothetical protein